MADELAAIKDMREEVTGLRREMIQEMQAADERLVKKIRREPTPSF